MGDGRWLGRTAAAPPRPHRAMVESAPLNWEGLKPSRRAAQFRDSPCSVVRVRTAPQSCARASASSHASLPVQPGWSYVASATCQAAGRVGVWGLECGRACSRQARRRPYQRRFDGVQTAVPPRAAPGASRFVFAKRVKIALSQSKRRKTPRRKPRASAEKRPQHRRGKTRVWGVVAGAAGSPTDWTACPRNCLAAHRKNP